MCSFQLDQHDAWIDSCNEAFNKVFANTRSCSFDEAKSAITEVRNEFVSRAHGDTLRLLIIERCFNERLLMAACRSNCPLQFCKVSYDKCVELGFRDIVTEPALTLAFARYCHAQGDKELAHDLLNKVFEKFADLALFCHEQQSIAFRTLISWNTDDGQTTAGRLGSDLDI